jgi:hypothetical protein
MTYSRRESSHRAQGRLPCPACLAPLDMSAIYCIALKMSTSARQTPSPSRRKMHKDFPGTSMLEPSAVRTRVILRPIAEGDRQGAAAQRAHRLKGRRPQRVRQRGVTAPRLRNPGRGEPVGLRRQRRLRRRAGEPRPPRTASVSRGRDAPPPLGLRDLPGIVQHGLQRRALAPGGRAGPTAARGRGPAWAVVIEPHAWARELAQGQRARSCATSPAERSAHPARWPAWWRRPARRARRAAPGRTRTC